VNNITGHHGATRPKKKTEAYRLMLVQEYTNLLEFAAVLTKNDKISSVALPVDVVTIRNYDLIAKDYELPPLQTDGGSTLLPAFIKSVEESYEVYCQEDEANYRSNGVGTYMHKTNFSDTLKPLLGDIIRYCIKYWFLHPWLSCQDAYTKGI
jgi:hypothetical protein